jgi:hypothetical protein
MNTVGEYFTPVANAFVNWTFIALDNPAAAAFDANTIEVEAEKNGYSRTFR